MESAERTSEFKPSVPLSRSAVWIQNLFIAASDVEFRSTGKENTQPKNELCLSIHTLE